MKIALVHDFLTKLGGAERVLLALSEIFPHAPIYTSFYDESLDSYFRGKTLVISDLQRWYAKFRFEAKYFLPFLATAVESFDFSEFDLIISSSAAFSKGILTPAHCLHICYCHTPMRYVWDSYHQNLAEKAPRGIGGKVVDGILHNLRVWDRHSAHRVDVWVANSRNVARRIKKYYRADAKVIYPPVDTHKIKPGGEKEDFFLIVSRLSAYKRIDVAIQAFNLLKLPLIIIGEGEDSLRLKKMAGSNIQFLGWQDDEAKFDYLKKARALVFPGEEDFGIVPVEAMAAGTPVIAYGRGGVTESVVEGETGIFFPKLNPAGLIEGVKRFYMLEPKIRRSRLVKRAREFSKGHFRKEIRELVDKSLGNKKIIIKNQAS